jgi:hypothetical protein
MAPKIPLRRLLQSAVQSHEDQSGALFGGSRDGALESSDSPDSSHSSLLWLFLSSGLDPQTSRPRERSAQCSQDALMLGSWLKLARLLWLGRLRMVVRSASTGSALPIASLHIHPASKTATQLGLLLVHCEIAFPFQPFAPLTCAMHDSSTASLRLRRKSESVSKIIVLVSIESGRVQCCLVGVCQNAPISRACRRCMSRLQNPATPCVPCTT